MTMIDGGNRPEPESYDEIGGDPCGDLQPGDENLSMALGVPDPILVQALYAAQEEVYEVNVANGWFEDDRRFAEDIALLHSEVSEMLEAFREHGIEDATEQDHHHALDGTLPKPEGVGSEAADVLVRLLDTCKRHDISLAAEFARKLAYNRTRGYKHGGKTL